RTSRCARQSAPGVHMSARRFLVHTAIVTAALTPSLGAAQRTDRVPFNVGEELTYRATFSHLPVGTARMRVAGVDTVRGRAAYHLVFTIDGGIPGFRVHDRYESWVDTTTHASL